MNFFTATILCIFILYGCTDKPTPEKKEEPKKEQSEELDNQKWAKKVDNYFNMSELEKTRSDTDKTSKCVSTKNFKEAINNAVDIHLAPYKSRIQKLAPYYSVPSKLDEHIESSLISHKLCTGFNSSNLKDVLKNVPNQTVINLMNKFSENANSVRDNKEIAKGFWKKTFSCLAYTESLTTADTTSSYNVAKKFAYKKPLGVKFYSDPYQTEASRYNIGLFQFTPTASGNINPCIQNWNLKYPECPVSVKSTQKQLIELLGSSSQVFNSFCGVNKVVGTFAIQQNSSSKSTVFKTDENKPKGERCVTPFIWAGWGYNHFGPFQNSTGQNLEKLLTCILSE